MWFQCRPIEINMSYPSGATIYLGTKNMDITPELNKKMRGDFPEHAEHCEYVCLDVTNKDNIAEVADMIR